MAHAIRVLTWITGFLFFFTAVAVSGCGGANRTGELPEEQLSSAAQQLPQAPIAELTPVGKVRHIAMLIDHSGSMSSTDPGNLRFDSVELLGAFLNDCDRVSIGMFNGIVDPLFQSVLPLWREVRLSSTEFAELMRPDRPCNAAGARSFTKINLALQWGFEQLESFSEPDAERHIIILTDGEMDVDNSQGFSQADRDAISEALQLERTPAFRGTKVHVIGFSAGIGGQNSENRRFLQQLSTSGTVHYSPDAQHLFQAIRDALEEVKLDELVTEVVGGWKEFVVDDSISSLRLISLSGREPVLQRWENQVSRWTDVDLERAGRVTCLGVLTDPAPGRYRTGQDCDIGFDGLHLVCASGQQEHVQQGAPVAFSAALQKCSPDMRLLSSDDYAALGNISVSIEAVSQTSAARRIELGPAGDKGFMGTVTFDQIGEVTWSAVLSDGRYLQRRSVPSTLKVESPDETFVLSANAVPAGVSVEVSVVPRRACQDCSYRVRLISPQGSTVEERGLELANGSWTGLFTPMQEGQHEVRLIKEVGGTEVAVSEMNRSRSLEVLPAKCFAGSISPQRINVGTYFSPAEYDQANGFIRWWSELVTYLHCARPPQVCDIKFHLEFSKGAVKGVTFTPIGPDTARVTLEPGQPETEETEDREIWTYHAKLGGITRQLGRSSLGWEVRTDNPAVTGLPKLVVKTYTPRWWGLTTFTLWLASAIAIFIWLIRLAFPPAFYGYAYRVSGPAGRGEYTRIDNGIRQVEFGADFDTVDAARKLQKVFVAGIGAGKVVLTAIRRKNLARLETNQGAAASYRTDSSSEWQGISDRVEVNPSGLQIKIGETEILVDLEENLATQDSPGTWE